MRDIVIDEDDLGWHREALAGASPPVHEGEPHCGYYATRTTHRGPLRPAAIYRLSPWEPLICVVDGTVRDAADQWPYLAKRPISHDDYLQLCDRRGQSWATMKV